ncbi:SapB/AmfS family lanthipeptide [Streptomyces nondiastaticus]|nr:SapB/AmfS family lanthipeptide [Streptomyces sp. VNUA116]WKU49368.1 SapB/AmfS family lanthipeptide [Streptomyces sp. VNUA116]
MVLLDLQVMEAASAAEGGPGGGASIENPNSEVSLLLCH